MQESKHRQLEIDQEFNLDQIDTLNSKESQLQLSIETQHLLIKNPQTCYEIFSKFSSSKLEQLNLRGITKQAGKVREFLLYYPLQYIDMVLSDIIRNTEKYSDSTNLANFLIFLKQFQKLNRPSGQKFSNYYECLEHLFRQTKSIKVIRAIINCMKDDPQKYSLSSKKRQPLCNLLKPLKYGSDLSQCKLNNLEMIKKLKEQNLLIFQYEIQKVFQRCFSGVKTQFQSDLIIKLKQKPFQKLFRTLFIDLNNQQEQTKFIRDFTNFRVELVKSQPTIMYNPEYLHQGILTQQNLSFILKHKPWQFIVNLPQNLVNIEGGTILSYVSKSLTKNLLRSKQQDIDIYNSYKGIQKWLKFLELLLKNSQKELKVVQTIEQQEKQQQIQLFNKHNFICQVFQISSFFHNKVEYEMNEICQLFWQKILKNIQPSEQTILSFLNMLRNIKMKELSLQLNQNVIEIFKKWSVEVFLKMETSQLLSSLLQNDNIQKEHRQELNNLIIKYLAKRYESGDIEILNNMYFFRNVPIVVNQFMIRELKKLQQIDETDMLTRKQQLINKLRILSQLTNLVPQQKPQLVPQRIFEFCIENFDSSLNRLRFWISKFLSQQLIKQYNQKIIPGCYESFTEIFNKMVPIMKQWDQKTWFITINYFQDKEIVKQFTNMIKYLFKMVYCMKLRIFQFQQNAIQTITSILFHLSYTLQEAQYKCYNYLRTLSEQNILKWDKKKKFLQFAYKSKSIYGQLSAVYGELLLAIQTLIKQCDIKRSFKQQRSIFRSIGKQLKRLSSNQETSDPNQLLSLKGSLKSTKTLVLMNILDRLLLEYNDQGFKNLSYFSFIYSEIKENFVQVWKNLIKHMKQKESSQQQKRFLSYRYKLQIQVEHLFAKYVIADKRQRQNQEQMMKYFKRPMNVPSIKAEIFQRVILPHKIYYQTSCFFNGEYYEKGTKQMAYEIYLNQFCSILHTLDLEFWIDIQFDKKLQNCEIQFLSQIQIKQKYLEQQLHNAQNQYQILLKFNQNISPQTQKEILNKIQLIKSAIKQNQQASNSTSIDKSQIQKGQIKNVQKNESIGLTFKEYSEKIKQQRVKTLNMLLENMNDSTQSYQIVCMLAESLKDQKESLEYKQKINKIRLTIGDREEFRSAWLLLA